jgi:hypothetical protein
MAEVEREIAAYEKMQAELESAHVGKWVLIKDETLIGVYDGFEAAAADAVDRFGRGPYLLRQVGAPPLTLPASVVFNIRHA